MQPWTPMDWIAANWTHIVGWGGVLLFLYRGYKVLRNFEGYGNDLQTVRQDLSLVMTNHLPHLQKELEHTNENLEGLRTDVRDGFTRLTDSMNVVLTRVP